MEMASRCSLGNFSPGPQDFLNQPEVGFNMICQARNDITALSFCKTANKIN